MNTNLLRTTTASVGDGKKGMENIVGTLGIGSDEPVEDDEGGMVKLDLLDKEIIVRLKNLRLGRPTLRKPTGRTSRNSNGMQTKEAYLFLTRYLDFKIFRDDLPPPGSEMGFQEETSVHIGNLPIMVRSARCNLNPNHADENRRLSRKLHEDSARYTHLLRKYGEDPLDPGGYFIINGTERVLISMEDLAPNRVTVEKNKKYAHETQVAKIFSQKDGVRKPLNVEKEEMGC